jgi:hypothetical protein
VRVPAGISIPETDFLLDLRGLTGSGSSLLFPIYVNDDNHDDGNDDDDDDNDDGNDDGDDNDDDDDDNDDDNDDNDGDDDIDDYANYDDNDGH